MVKHTWLWVDNWHPHGPLMTKYGCRVIYDFMSRVNAIVSDVLSNGSWHMPRVLSRSLFAIMEVFP